MTVRAKQVIDFLSPRVFRQVQKLAQQRGETPGETVERAVALLAETEKKVGLLNDEDVLLDTAARSTFTSYLKALRRKTFAKRTSAERKKFAQSGGTARSKSLTAEERKKIAKAAAIARWAKNRDKPID